MPIPVVQEKAFRPRDENTHQAVLLPATVLTLNIPKGATEIVVQAVEENIRMTMDNTLPSATVGFQLVAGNVPVRIIITERTTLRFIREADGAYLQYEYGD